MADRLRRSRRLDEPLAACERSLAVREPLVAAYPDHPRYRALLGETYLRLGQLRCDMKALASAAAARKRACTGFDRVEFLSPDWMFLRGCCHAGLSGMGGRPGSDASAAAGANQAKKVIAVLRQGVCLGYHNPDPYRTESALDPLRERLDFKLMTYGPGDAGGAVRPSTLRGARRTPPRVSVPPAKTQSPNPKGGVLSARADARFHSRKCASI